MNIKFDRHGIDVVWTLLNYNLFNAITRVMRAINVCVSDVYSGRKKH